MTPTGPPPLPPPSQPPPLPAIETPRRTIGIAALWMLAALASAFGPAFMAGLAIGFHNQALHGHGAPWTLHTLDGQTWLGITGFNAALLAATWSRSRAPGLGNRSTQLAWSPIRWPGLLILLTFADLAYLIGILPILVHSLGITPHPIVIDWLPAAIAAPNPLRIANALATTLLAPIGEELFFRGWLWTKLRQHWRPLPVALLTALPWLLLHLTSGLERPFLLIPAAILFSLARHHCRSVRASIILHIINNATVVAALLLAEAVSPGITV